MLKPIIGDGKVNGELFTDLRRHWLLQKPNGQATIRNYLVIKLRYMGDVLLSTPVFRGLRKHFPHARICALVNHGTEEILRRNPDINEIFLVPRSGWKAQLLFLRNIRTLRFDCVIDLTDGDRSAFITGITGAPLRIGFNHERRWRGWLYSQAVEAPYGAMHMVDYHAQALTCLGISTNVGEPELFVGEEDELAADRLLHHAGWRGEKWVMIHPAARYWFKAWPPERFAGLSDTLIERGLKVVLVGHSDDQGIGDVVQGTAKHKLISLIGQTSLMVLAGLMKRCALFIGNDGGPMHMAAAVGCPVVALFGPTDPMVWGPKGKQTAVLYKGLDCRDCFYPGCFRGESSCMKQISVDEVYEAARRFI